MVSYKTAIIEVCYKSAIIWVVCNKPTTVWTPTKKLLVSWRFSGPYGVTKYGSGWRKDVVNPCLEFGSTFVLAYNRLKTENRRQTFSTSCNFPLHKSLPRGKVSFRRPNQTVFQKRLLQHLSWTQSCPDFKTTCTTPPSPPPPPLFPALSVWDSVRLGKMTNVYTFSETYTLVCYRL